MRAYYITIVVILVVLCLAAVAIWAVNSYYDIRNKKAKEAAAEKSKGPARVKNDDVYLHVQDGKVTVLEELSVAAAATDSVTYPYAEVKEEEEAVSSDEEPEVLPESPTDGGSDIREEAPEKTFHEGFMELTPTERDRYQKFTEYVLSNKDCRKTESMTEITFKCRTDKVVSAVIKNGAAELRFMLVNSDMHRYIRESGAKNVKITPVVVVLDSDESLALAKRTADITIKNYREEQYYRKQKRRESRR